jgi:hypothetical protein
MKKFKIQNRSQKNSHSCVPLKEHGVVTRLRISAQIRSENRKFSVFVEITYAKPI